MDPAPRCVAWLLVAGCGIAGCASASSPSRAGPGEAIEQRIRFHSSKLERNPRLYPVHVQLAGAYFAKARETHDPRWLAEARLELERSIAIVPTYEAFVAMARIANYAHRFEDAVYWGRRALAQPADVPNSAVTAVVVEALAALGRTDEVEAVLPPLGTAPIDFHTSMAWAGWLASQGRHEDAARAYDAAGAIARATSATKAAAWAEALAAGALVDAGRPELARPRLESARRADPSDVLVRMHHAECLLAEGRVADALGAYEALLEERPRDPELHAEAAKVARMLGDKKRAAHHFRAAERGFRRVLEAHEVYTLGSLARLYCDAGIRLAEALALAEQNLAYRRDREAQALAVEVRRKLAAAQ